MKMILYVFLCIYFAKVILLTESIMNSLDVMTFIEKVALNTDSSVIDRAIAFSAIGMYLKDKIKLDEVDKKHYCSSLTKYVTNGKTHSPEELYFAHNAFSYLSCGSLSLNIEQLKIHFTQTNDLSMVNHLVKLGALYNIGAEKFIVKESLSKYDRDDLTELEKLQLSRVKCLIGNKEKSDGVKSLEVISKQYTDSSDLSSNNSSAHSLLILTLFDCKAESLLDDEKMALVIEHMDSGFKFDNLLKCWDTLEAYIRLATHESFVYIQPYASRFFKVIENSKILNFAVRDALKKLTLQSHVSLHLESAKCDGKDVKSILKPHIDSNGFYLSVDSALNDCSFVLKAKSSKPNVRMLRPIIYLNASTSKVLKVIDINIHLIDSSNEQSIKTKSVTFGSDISNLFNGCIKKLKLEFVITHVNNRIKPHQVFLNLHHESLNFHTTFIAEPDQNGRYSCDFNTEQHGNGSFFYLSGSYKMELVIGDFSIPEVIKWQMGKVQLEFNKPSILGESHFDRKILPELHNYPKVLFKNPPFIISLFFTCLIGAMLFIQFLMWSKMGLKISFKLSLTRILFYLSFSGVFVVCYLYWTKFSGFEALPYYLVAGIATCLTLNYVLTPKCQI